MNPRYWIACTVVLFFCYGCESSTRSESSEHEIIPIIQTALFEPASPFFGNFGNYPSNLTSAPIGIFDSGTGGLTVMEAILTLDLFNNTTGEEGSDGVYDFAGETFIYLADQANMPYGNYSSENKTDYLREIIIQDALFLMKNEVKSVVIACNTATATGLTDIQKLLEMSNTGVSVTGVINAGVKGALESLDKEESGTIGVMATVGTIKTEGYERIIREMAKELGYSGDLQVVNQPAMGFAEAVDEEPDFVLRSAQKPRSNYRGPSLHHSDYPIDPQLLDAYRFDFTNHAILQEKESGNLVRFQLNSAQNYARYHLLSMMEKIKASPNPLPLKVLIMGCTHYPYHKETLQKMLIELQNYHINGHFPYRDLISQEVVLVDPSINTAKELYLLLRREHLLSQNISPAHSLFYITIPNGDLPGVELETPTRFTYDYKYGRYPGSSLLYVNTVPFSSDFIDEATLSRFRSAIPVTFSMIPSFDVLRDN